MLVWSIIFNSEVPWISFFFYFLFSDAVRGMFLLCLWHSDPLTDFRISGSVIKNFQFVSSSLTHWMTFDFQVAGGEDVSSSPSLFNLIFYLFCYLDKGAVGAPKRWWRYIFIYILLCFLLWFVNSGNKEDERNKNKIEIIIKNNNKKRRKGMWLVAFSFFFPLFYLFYFVRNIRGVCNFGIFQITIGTLFFVFYCGPNLVVEFLFFSRIFINLILGR